jgi:hypothetical protein
MPGLECSSVGLDAIMSQTAYIDEQARTLERHYVIAHIVTGKTAVERVGSRAVLRI